MASKNKGEILQTGEKQIEKKRLKNKTSKTKIVTHERDKKSASDNISDNISGNISGNIYAGGDRQRRSTLLSKNIRIGRHRTSVRLEPIFWDILQHITKREKMSVHVVCTKVAERAPQLPLTGALRIFLIAYAWRAGMSPALEAVRTGKMEL